MADPDFLIIGAMKAGTTLLADLCRLHPQLLIPRGKEIHFFDRNWELGLTWYRSQLPKPGPGQAVGEATPIYMYDATARGRMLDSYPGMQGIAILRDPVDRAYAHYWHERRRAREALSFEAALEAEPRRLEAGDMDVRAHSSYVDRGLYADQLDAVTAVLPRHRLLVLVLEELLADPSAEFGKLCDFLGVARRDPPEPLPHSNAWRQPDASRLRRRLVAVASRSGLLGGGSRGSQRYPKMSDVAAERLTAFYAEPNRRLTEEYGVTIKAWRHPRSPLSSTQDDAGATRRNHRAQQAGDQDAT